nr:hypothetical protein [Sweet potato chlorotic stunt virus]
MDFSELIDEHGREKISFLVQKLMETKRTGVGIVNLLLNLINENYIHFDTKRPPCGFEKEDYILILKIVPLLRI